MLTTLNLVACEPFPERQIKTERKAGLALMEQTQKLTKLKVLYPSNVTIGNNALMDGPPPNTYIFVKGETMAHQWAAEVLTHEDGTKFILVPFTMIIGFDDTRVK